MVRSNIASENMSERNESALIVASTVSRKTSRSKAWEYFDIVGETESAKKKVKCKCGTVLLYCPANGTSSMYRHLDSCLNPKTVKQLLLGESWLKRSFDNTKRFIEIVD